MLVRLLWLFIGRLLGRRTSKTEELEETSEPLLPTSTKTIDYQQLHTILRGQFPKANIFLSDSVSTLCSYDDIALFLAQDDTNRMEYKAESLDCDDFSFRLMGQFSFYPWSALAIGIVWTDAHALNCFVAEDEIVYFIEPQTGTIFTELAPWQGSYVKLVVL